MNARTVIATMGTAKNRDEASLPQESRPKRERPLAAMLTSAVLAVAGTATSWAGDIAPAWQADDFVMEEVVVTAKRPSHLYMEEIVVTAKRPEIDPTVTALSRERPKPRHLF